MQFVLWVRHEQLKERHQSPCVALKAPAFQTLFHFLDILDTPNQLVSNVQQLVPGSIQLLHQLCHPAVMALATMSNGQLTVRTPACGARPSRARTVDSNLSSVHAERIKICTGTSHLRKVYISIYCFILVYTRIDIFIPCHQDRECAYPHVWLRPA
jgi:hypothetical protein